MSPEKPPGDESKEEELKVELGVRHLNPEQAAELIEGMRENIAGLESWLAERREFLTSLEADTSISPKEIEELRKEIWELAEDIAQQKEFIEEGMVTIPEKKD